MEIIGLILGVLLLIGVFSIPKADETAIDDSKYRLLIQGGRIIKRFAIPILIILLGFFGYQMFQKMKKENEALKVENEKIKAKKEREFTLSKLISIVDKPQHEKETAILGFDFEIDGNSDDGVNYSRDYDAEVIQNWHNGTVRYVTSNKENYVRIRNQLSEEKYEFLREDTNDQNDKFSEFNKGNYFIWAGTFSKSKEYLIVAKDTAKYYTPPTFFSNKEFIGKWGRIGEPIVGQSGSFTIKPDKTFTFQDSKSGYISGTWKIEKREIIFNYNSAKDKRYSSPHPLSNKTEVVYIERKGSREISGFLRGETYAPKIILIKK